VLIPETPISSPLPSQTDCLPLPPTLWDGDSAEAFWLGRTLCCALQCLATRRRSANGHFPTISFIKKNLKHTVKLKEQVYHSLKYQPLKL
jgi:hypothetical protein